MKRPAYLNIDVAHLFSSLTQHLRRCSRSFRRHAENFGVHAKSLCRLSLLLCGAALIFLKIAPDFGESSLVLFTNAIRFLFHALFFRLIAIFLFMLPQFLAAAQHFFRNIAFLNGLLTALLRAVPLLWRNAQNRLFASCAFHKRSPLVAQTFRRSDCATGTLTRNAGAGALRSRIFSKDTRCIRAGFQYFFDV